MKKIFIMLFSVLAVSLGTVSCSDNETDPTDKKGEQADSTEKTDDLASDTADYTVIFWGMAGKQDAAAVIDLNTIAKNYLKGRIGKNVNIAGLLKTSMGFYRSNAEDESMPQDSDKTWYFDSHEIGSDTLTKTNTLPTSAQLLQDYKTVFKLYGAKEYSDRNFPMDNVDSLATFIKRTAEAFPARHYVLLMWGHGTGFLPEDEAPYTRSCVLDNYGNEFVGLTSSMLANAVDKSGVKIQTLFTQCCLMGALENMAVYSKVFDYAILSAESTSAFYFPEYLVYLSQAGDDEEKMKKASRDLVDYYRRFYDGELAINTTSQGFYDLTKTPQLLDVVKEATEWYMNNYDDADLQKKINWALAHAIYCQEIDNKDAIAKSKLVRQYIYDKLEGKAGSYDRESLVNVFTAWTYLVNNFSNSQGYCLSDVMRQTLDALPEDKKASLQGIYDRYMKTLKSMAYIQANQVPDKADSDYPYIYASPTVNIFSLHPDYYIPLSSSMNDEVTEMIDAMVKGDETTASNLYRKLFDGALTATGGYLDTARKNLYKSSNFNQETGWVNFLEKLTFNPGFYVNPDRSVVNEWLK